MGAETILELSAGPLELALAPALGGSMLRFDWREKASKIALLRRAEGVPGSVLDTASFPLVPFSNRIRNGRFAFRNRNVTLAANMQGDPSPLHGQGWLAPWKMLRSNSCEADLVYEHESGAWPWRYEARQ